MVVEAVEMRVCREQGEWFEGDERELRLPWRGCEVGVGG